MTWKRTTPLRPLICHVHLWNEAQEDPLSQNTASCPEDQKCWNGKTELDFTKITTVIKSSCNTKTLYNTGFLKRQLH